MAATEKPIFDDQGRPEPPVNAGECATLLGFLDFQRATLAWKCRGLAADGLGATTAASKMTLGGLLKHMAYVEDLWFSRQLHGNDPTPPWDTVDWDANHDWEWDTAPDDSPDELFALWEEAVDRSRARVDEVIAADGTAAAFDRPARQSWSDGRAPNLRWIVVHMIEEYARHNGHADLLREAVDGETGE